MAVPSLAQSGQNTWVRLQGGYGLTGTGDRNGFVGNLSGGRYFSPRFKAGLGLGYAGFGNGVFTPADGNKASALTLDLSAYFHVVNTNWFKVEVGAGPNVRFWQLDYETDALTTIFISRYKGDIRLLPSQSVSIDDTL